MTSTKSFDTTITLHSGFIPSIEGMRALAILAVLLFHLEVPGFSCGYLGVDLFFVISGFIITRNILSDDHRGRFSFREFYVRRFRRLYPALLVTVLLTLLFAAINMPPVELEKTGQSALYALFSLANFNFWLESDYFDAAAYTKPLLHTWSLSLEEQFYLLWPGLLLLLGTIQRRVVWIISLLLLSLISSLLLQNSFASGVFYLLPFRVHQLMAGALIAILTLRLSPMVGKWAIAMASAGLIVLFTSTKDSFSPALGAVMVTVLGSLLLLSRDVGWAQMIYGNRPMQWIGARSYAIYLVHWPIIVLYKNGYYLQLGMKEIVGLLTITTLFAILLHELVEKPFRKTGADTTSVQKSTLPALFALLLFTVSLAIVIVKSDGLSFREDANVLVISKDIQTGRALRDLEVRNGQCDLTEKDAFTDYNVTSCATLDPSRPNVLVLGDSTAADSYMMLVQTYADIHFLQATAAWCTPVLEIKNLWAKYPACLELNEYRFSELARLDVDLVILSSLVGHENTAEIRAVVDYLRNLGRKVVILGPRVNFKNGPAVFMREAKNFNGLTLTAGDAADRNVSILNSMRASLPDVTIIDMASIQCEDGCDIVSEGRLLYLDWVHLTWDGAKHLGNGFKEAFDLPSYIKNSAVKDP